jgi:hypothetical protein
VNWTRSIREPECAAYIVTTAVALVPIWATAVFPSQDGGAHLYNGYVLAALARGVDAAQYSDIYTLNFAALANWADHVVLALLTSVLSPASAEKVLLSAYVLLFAAAARYAANAIRHDQGWVAHLALPLIFTFSVHMGFYNFILCFPLYFFLIGYYWRHRDGHHRRGLVLLMLAMYVLHPLAWLFGVLTLTIIVVANARQAHAHGHTSPQTTARRLLHVWLAAAPGAILLLVLVGNEPSVAAEWQPFPALVRHLYLGGPLWTFGPVDTWFGAALFGLFALVTIAAWRSASADDARTSLAWATGAYVALLIVLPSQWKSLGLITERVGTFAFLTWVVALSAQIYTRRIRAATIVAAQVLALLLIARWTTAAVALEPYVEEYLSIAPHVDPASRVLALNFATRGRAPDGARLSHPVAPFAHTIGHVGVQRNAVILNDYEALTEVFPLEHRSEAAEALANTLHDPPDLRMADLDRFERAVCRPVDTIVIWQADPDDQRTKALLRMLADDYVLTYVSQPRGYAEVHKRRGDVPCR